VEVKLVEHPDLQGKEQYVIARSTERAEKESAMLAQAKARLLATLEQIASSLRKRPAKLSTIERRIGRWMGKYSRAERFYQVNIRTTEISKPTSGSKRQNTPQTMAVGLEITEKEVPLTWAERSAGAYLLRTNCTDKDPDQLWTWYVQLTQAEECFRISKSDLHLRPVFHQKTERVDAHILVCFLTLAMWRSLEMWMKSKGLGNCARQLLKEIATVHMMDVILPVRDQGELNLRVVSKPDEQVAQLLAHLELELPAAPKIISNVVAKNH
jgi:transposase